MEDHAICPCGCDRFINIRKLVVKGKLVHWFNWYACESCGKELEQSRG